MHGPAATVSYPSDAYSALPLTPAPMCTSTAASLLCWYPMAFLFSRLCGRSILQSPYSLSLLFALLCFSWTWHNALILGLYPVAHISKDSPKSTKNSYFKLSHSNNHLPRTVTNVASARPATSTAPHEQATAQPVRTVCRYSIITAPLWTIVSGKGTIDFLCYFW